VFAPALQRVLDSADPATMELSARLLSWAESLLGDQTATTLARGYGAFSLDVSRSQARYEKTRRYQNTTFAEAAQAVYFNDEWSHDYHWGVYATTFAWPHHVELWRFFRDQFLSRLEPKGMAVDLGCGSAVWSCLLAADLHDWQATGVDISPRFVELASALAEAAGLSSRVAVSLNDALTWAPNRQFDAGISCFVLEHLEDPGALMSSMNRLLKPHGYAFVTGALTAAESDHIFEFTRESELVSLAEDHGFRVVATLSASPPSYPQSMHYLPRSMAMVIQRRITDSW
jgi:SAM-dependent methyltransferase